MQSHKIHRITTTLFAPVTQIAGGRPAQPALKVRAAGTFPALPAKSTAAEIALLQINPSSG